MSFPFKPVLLAAIVSQTFPAFAADPIPQAYQELNEVKVIGGRKVQKLGEEKIRTILQFWKAGIIARIWSSPFLDNVF